MLSVLPKLVLPAIFAGINSFPTGIKLCVCLIDITQGARPNVSFTYIYTEYRYLQCNMLRKMSFKLCLLSVLFYYEWKPLSHII